ncbi:hypothetical protein [Psychrobacillus antarcticus]|uniref:hypothetical protein n=1 Tax=Psychrobacillus antarcticus TaxID=2879115 RepID=UPI002407EFCF|nr:hypothetical protein [Psychrobacillus antarcticus]
MNKYIPTEVKDLTVSKQRVMRNVVDEIEHNQVKPKYKWRYVVITTILIMIAMLFVLNETFMETEQQSATKLQLDFTKPTFSEEQGLLYLNGVTLGDSQSKVIEHLGENYSVEYQEDGSIADFILDYEGIARFYFYQDKLDSIIFMKVDETYFDNLFNNYNGFKFLTPTSGNDRYFYLKETGLLLKATIIADGTLYLYLMRGGMDLLENPDFPKIEQILD